MRRRAAEGGRSADLSWRVMESQVDRDWSHQLPAASQQTLLELLQETSNYTVVPHKFVWKVLNVNMRIVRKRDEGEPYVKEGEPTRIMTDVGRPPPRKRGPPEPSIL